MILDINFLGLQAHKVWEPLLFRKVVIKFGWFQEAADHSTSFETARTHITSKPQGTSNNNVINKRRSLLGRNEVILLTSDSDSSDNDDEKKATRIQPNRTQRNNSRRNVVVEHNSPSNDGRECLLSYMSESRIASVERWIVSSPFASSATSTTRKSFGIRLEDVEIGASGKVTFHFSGVM